jgi:hypothetical protein
VGRIELSADVETYLRRALPHFLAGKSAQEAMEAVLEDDVRLTNKLLAQTYSVSHGAAGDGGPLVTADGGSSELGQHLSATVYNELRRAA